MKRMFFTGKPINKDLYVCGDGIMYPPKENGEQKVFIDGTFDGYNGWVEVGLESVEYFEVTIIDNVIRRPHLVKVKYKFSKYKWDESYNTLTIPVGYYVQSILLGDRNESTKEKYKKMLVKHISALEGLNDHISSSVEIISIVGG